MPTLSVCDIETLLTSFVPDIADLIAESVSAKSARILEAYGR